MPDFLADLQQHFAGEFTVERELGGGGMSRVVLARDERLQRRVVIKVLPSNITATISADRFKREIMLSASLQHPNIVPVLRAGEIEGLPYFVMPYIEGESLRTRMRRGPLSVRETVNILKDVVRALTFAHGHGIVHRDIKPDNVLLSAGAAVVTDFGVAKALSASRYAPQRAPAAPITGVGMSPGTPAYMAPEQAAADPDTDHRADLYSLGILAYEMLAGTPPFYGRTPQALLAAQLSETPPALSSRRYDVPKALSDLIAQCLQKDPRKRPESAQYLLRELEDPVMVSGIFDAPAEIAQRSRRSALTGWLLAGAAVATTIWLVFSGTREKAAAVPASASGTLATVGGSLAVLPFDAIGGDVQSRQVADGITSELTTAMAGVPGLRVSSRATAAAIRNRQVSRDSSSTTDVLMLLDGSVQRERGALRVSVRLLRAATDSTMWAQTFNGVTDSVFQLQSAIVQSVTAAVTRSILNTR